MLSNLEEDRTRLAVLDAQILDLENSIAARLERALVKGRLHSYRYPVLTLPNEIVSEIFTQFLPCYPCFPPLIGPHSPTFLTHICHTWREIALSTPSLWSAIPLSFDFDDISFKQQARLSNLWLKRSRSSPLSIQIDGVGDGTYTADITLLLKSVLRHRTRCQSLKLQVSSSQLRAIEGIMPSLRHLDLVLDGGATSVALGGLPLLRSVALNDVAASRVILPWAQLTSLVLRGVYLRECVPIFKQSSSLLHCKLHLFYFADESSVNITHLRLESLVLYDAIALWHDAKYQPPSQYLESFNTPALCSLDIPERFLGPNPILSLKEFVSKSGSKLREVHITDQRSIPATSYREALQLILRLSFDTGHDSSVDQDYWSVDDSDLSTESYSGASDATSTDSEEE
ncbi:hypothetical protein K438DRAFT_1813985 [Mycena galopus ATCC 62051]|nr:hypothetical protein K438DRAFT_1813985 [Mycena galopus ATCC 62051]